MSTGRAINGEKKMRVKTLLAVAGALALSSSVASAAIKINSQRSNGSGENAGFQIIRFYATIPVGDPEAGIVVDPIKGNLQGLQSADVAMSIPTGAFRFRFTDIGNEGYGDILTDFQNVPFPKNPTAQNQSNLATGVKVGAFATWFEVSTVPSPHSAAFSTVTGQRTGPRPEDVFGLVGVPADDDPNYANTFNHNFQSNLKLFRVSGTNKDGPDSGAVTNDNSPGSGSLFAIAVVPTGTPVRIFSDAPGTGLAGKTGSINAVDYTDAVPEPTSLGILGLAALMGRRRRKA